MAINPLLRASGADAPARGDEMQPTLASNPYANTPSAVDYENGWQYAQGIGAQQLTLAEDDQLARWARNPIPWRQGLADAAKAMGVPGISEALDPAAQPPAQPQTAFPTSKTGDWHPAARTLAWAGGTGIGGLLGGSAGMWLSNHVVPEQGVLGIGSETLEKGVAAVPAALGAGAGGFIGEALNDQKKQKVLARIHTDPHALPMVVGLPTKQSEVVLGHEIIHDADTGRQVQTSGSFAYGNGERAYIAVDDGCYQIWVDAGNGGYRATSHLWDDAVAELKSLPINPRELGQDDAEIIPGGKAEGRTFDPALERQGQQVEMEHTDSKPIATEITRDHLTEDDGYYDDLAKMEAKHAFATEHLTKLAESPMLQFARRVTDTAIHTPRAGEVLRKLPSFVANQAGYAAKNIATGVSSGARAAVQGGRGLLNKVTPPTQPRPDIEIIPNHPSDRILHPVGTLAAMKAQPAAGPTAPAPDPMAGGRKPVRGVKPDMSRPTEQLIAQSEQHLDNMARRRGLHYGAQLPGPPTAEAMDHYIAMAGQHGSSHPEARRAHLGFLESVLDANRR